MLAGAGSFLVRLGVLSGGSIGSLHARDIVYKDSRDDYGDGSRQRWFCAVIGCLCSRARDQTSFPHPWSHVFNYSPTAHYEVESNRLLPHVPSSPSDYPPSLRIARQLYSDTHATPGSGRIISVAETRDRSMLPTEPGFGEKCYRNPWWSASAARGVRDEASAAGSLCSEWIEVSLDCCAGASERASCGIATNSGTLAAITSRRRYLHI